MTTTARYFVNALVNDNDRLVGYLVNGQAVFIDEPTSWSSVADGLFDANNTLVGYAGSTKTFSNGNTVLLAGGVSGYETYYGLDSYWFSRDGFNYDFVVKVQDEEFEFATPYEGKDFFVFTVADDLGDSNYVYSITDTGQLNGLIGGYDGGPSDFVVRDDAVEFAFWSEGNPLDTYVTDGTVLRRLSEVDAAPTALTIDRTRTSESAQAGFVVARFAALDPDAQDRIFYHIVADSTGGALTVAGDALIVAKGMRFDFETAPQIAVTIRAVDLAGNAIDRSFVLDVLDVDANRPPVITSDGGGATAFIALGERELVVTQVAAADPDAGTTFDFTIVGGADAALLRIDASTGALSFRNPTDFEAPADADRDNVYEVTVSASDGVFDVAQRLSIAVLDRPDGGEQIVAMRGSVGLSSNGTANGSAGADTIAGSVRADNIYGKAGDDIIGGGDGNDSLRGDGGSDLLMGEAGSDLLDGGAGRDRMIGGPGDDLYIVDDAGDQMLELAGQGRDTVRASVSWTLGTELEVLELTGTAHLTGQGNALDNKIRGNAGDNLLIGGAGRDVIEGGDGWDVLIGGPGGDQLTGGAGSDRFRFDQVAAAGERDVITDFAHGVDRIELAATAFGLTASALSSALLTIGSTAATAATRLVYDPHSGVLSYDPDGSGAAASVQLAQFTGTPLLSASDFAVI